MFRRKGLHGSAMLLLATVLAGCSDDPPSACFKRGDHDIMSDGKITLICDCALKQVGSARMGEGVQGLLVDVIHGRGPKAGDETQHREMAQRWASAHQSCKAVAQ